MELRAGYKNTEIGVIPEDWKVKPLYEVLHITGGGTFKSIDRVKLGVKWLKIANVGINQIKWKEIDYLPVNFINTYSNYVLKSRDLVMALTRPILREKLKISFISQEDTPCLLNQRVAKIEEKENALLKFLYFILQSKAVVDDLQDSMAGTDPPNLSNNGIYKIKIPLPPLPEQTAIANVLSDTDNLLQTLEKKIVKKRLIKQGTMQELLKPKEGWVVKSLGEICEKITTGKLDANAMVKDGKYRFYTCAMNYSFIDDYAFDTEALLVSGNGANVGYIHYYKGKFNSYQRTYVLDGFSENIFFVKLYMDKFLKKRIDEQKNDGNTPYIKMDTLYDMIINVPNTQEQNRIATILSDMDTEIENLEKQLEKYKQVKQGLMQNLLTGKIRLV